MSFINLENQPSREILPGYHGQFVHSDMLTLAYWEVESGAPLPEHSHHHEQIANVLEGKYELTIAGQKQILGPGQVAVIPGNVPHSGRAITACRLLDVFHPARDDYR